MNNINNDSNKEYIEYKDGKVIPVKDNSISKMSLSKKVPLYIKRIKNKRLSVSNLKETIIKRFSLKYLFLGFVIFSSILFYLFYFTNIIPPKEATPPNHNSSGSVVDSVIKGRIDKDNLDKAKEDNIPGSLPKEDEDGDDTNIEGININQQLISFSEKLNSDIYTKNIEENAKVKDYTTNKLNRVTTLKSLNRLMNEKQKLYLLLVTNKESFQTADKLDFYEILEQRLITSIKKTETILELVTEISSNKSIDEKITNYNENDTLLKDTYDIILMEFLDFQNVKYEKTQFVVKFNLIDIK